MAARMTIQRLPVALSALAGLVVGLAVGYLIPIGIGLGRGENPLHTGSYMMWALFGMIAFGVGISVGTAVLHSKDRLLWCVRVVWTVAVLIIGVEAVLWFLG